MPASAPPPRSYATAAGGGNSQSPTTQQNNNVSNQAPTGPSNGTKNHTKQQQPPLPTSSEPHRRSPSPSHRPRTTNSQNGEEEETVYVLTLQTDPAHHTRMTALRTKYFPPRINKLEAHLTLFHALPSSHLTSSILPHLTQISQTTAPFPIRATHPFRLKKGIAISIPKAEGGAEAQVVHKRLQGKWAGEGWLSEQDSGGCRVHYTVMNKVDEEAVVEAALGEVRREFERRGGDEGVVVGLGLWRYERGFWRWERGFEFGGGEEGGR